MHDVRYRFADVVVDPAGREIRRGGARIALEPKAFDVLVVLLRDAGRVVDKRRLLKEVWADVHVTDSSLARAVTQVRRAIGDDHRQPLYVETVPTRGYKFVGRLLDTFDEPVPQSSTSSPRPTAMPRATAADVAPEDGVTTRVWPRPARRRIVALIALLVLGIAGLLWWSNRSGPARDASAEVGEALVRAATQSAVQLTTSGGADIDPVFSPDGTLIAYASDASGAFEILVRPRTGTAPARAVTANGGDNVNPAWSPDGQWLAFHSRRFGGIWIVPSGGGPPRQLVTDGAAPNWSPDGQRLVYQTAVDPDVQASSGAALSTLAIVDVATGTSRVLTERGGPPGAHLRPLWVSPARIAFVSSRVPLADLWEVTLDGALTHLAECESTCRFFSFIRGGAQWIGVKTFFRNPALWTAPIGADGAIDRARAATTPLPATARVVQLVVSPDGRQLAFSEATRSTELWFVDPSARAADGLPSSRLLLDERRPTGNYFAFSPDGHALAYTTARAGGPMETWLRDLRSGTSRQVASPLVGLLKGWTPDGRAVLLVENTGERAVHRLDVQTGRAETLVRFEGWKRIGFTELGQRLYTLRLSPDLRRSVHTAEVDGRLSLWLSDLGPPSASPAGRIDGPLEGASFGRWSPDGRRIAYQASEGWRVRLAIHDLARDRSEVLVRDADIAMPNDWSPDGRSVVFAAMRAGRWTLDVADTRTGAVRSLTSPGGAAEYVRWPVWSPRDDRILYERVLLKGNVWVASVPDISP